MTLQDINALLQLNTTKMRTFSKDDLTKYIDDYWSLSIQINPDVNVTTSQMDGGANTNVTNNKRILRQYRSVQSIPVTGVGDNGPACMIKGEGYMDIKTNEGDWLTIKTYYAPRCNGTIISPNAIVEQDKSFTSWTQHSHLDTKNATILFYHKDQYHKRKSLTMGLQNNLWFIQQPLIPTIKRAQNQINVSQIIEEVKIHHLSTQATYELWHQRLLHPGQMVMNHMQECTDGIPSLNKPAFHTCDTCQETKGTKIKNKHTTNISPTSVGEQFHMDIGFVHGKQNNRIIRSHDGFDSYILITDAKTRYLWMFLCKNKNPPLKTVQLFLDQHGLKSGTRIVRTDQGGELAKSKLMQDTIAAAGYSLEITGSDNSSQNGTVKRPHRTLANMMRAALTNSGLSAKYWSDALVHSVFIKNRLPHAAFKYKSTPYTELTGTKPNMDSIRIFGSPITTRKPGRRPVKLDNHCYNGIFLRFAKTLRNIVYLDTLTKKIKTTTYATFDEAHYSSQTKPRGAQRLLQTGIPPSDTVEQPKHDTPAIKLMHTTQQQEDDYLYVKLSDKDAIIPRMATTKSAGYDLHTIEDGTIPPLGTAGFSTGIAIRPPKNTYGRIASRSGLVLKHNIETKAGVIDADYTGDITVILHNFSKEPYTVKKGDRIAQLILEQHKNAQTKEAQILPTTDRGSDGFGSTGQNTIKATTTPLTPHNIDLPDIDLTDIPPNFTMQIKISPTGTHETLGLITTTTKEGVIIKECKKSTPSAKIPKWRQHVRNGILLSINNKPIKTQKDVIDAIKQARISRTTVICTISTKQSCSIHPETGIPQLHFDQIGILTKILQEVIHDEKDIHTVDEAPPLDNAVKVHKATTGSLTRTKSKKQEDWPEWQQSEFLQPDQYQTQNIFSEPM